jgi:cell division protein FtsQ
MSSDYIYAAPLGPAASAPSKLDKLLKRLIVIILMILAAEVLWLAGIRPCMPLSVVEVTGIPGIGRDAVLAQAGINGETSYLAVHPREIERALETMYQVDSARVIKRFPDTVRIILESRRPVALSLAQVGGRTAPLFFDRNGVIFKVGNADSEFPAAMPIVSGLIFENAAVGMRLPLLFAPLFTELERIHDSAPELLAAISEIRINRKTYDGFDLVLYPVHNHVRVRIGRELNEDTLRYMMLVIDVLLTQGVDVDEIDFRTGTASYTVKEASSG